METKKVRIKADRTAAVADLGSAFLVEGNTDYEIEFIFDDESWDEYPAKTAYFSWGRDGYAEVVFTGSVVQMPAITSSIIVYVGVYAGDLRTSADAIFGVIKNARSKAGHEPPDLDVYNQIMQLIAEGAVKGKSPYVGEDGIWYEWDTDTSAYVSTGITARGPQGIQGIQGPQGEPGETGNGIDHVELGEDYRLTVYMTDGTSYMTNSIRGATGNGISDLKLIRTEGPNKTYRMTFTDGQTYDFTITDGTATDEQVEAWLTAHPEATTTVQDGAITWAKLADETKAIIRDIVSVRTYGATGDGTTDDTVAIIQAVSHLHDFDTLYFPPGVYKMSVSADKQSLINLTNLIGVMVYGHGAKILIAPNAFPNYNVIHIHNSDKITVYGIEIEGDRIGHTYNQAVTSKTHEFGYGIMITGDASAAKVNAEIKNCYIHHMTGDAIVTKNGISGGVIRVMDTEMSYCRRQGLSVLDSDIVQLERCNIHNIGNMPGSDPGVGKQGVVIDYTNYANGTSPFSGIDIEPGSGSKHINAVYIEDCHIRHCTRSGVVTSEKCDLCKITRSDVNAVGGAGMWYAYNSTIIADVENVYFSGYNFSFTFGGLLQNCIIDARDYPEDIVGESVSSGSNFVRRMEFCTVYGKTNANGLPGFSVRKITLAVDTTIA